MLQTIHTVVFRAMTGGGNPCPVTLHADQLTTKEMQRMTKEFGEEAVFLMRPTRPDCDVKARYFVPLHEMEMCIHATIASATVLVEQGLLTVSPIRYETVLGPIRVDWEQNNGSLRVGVHQFLPRSQEHSPTREELCKALNIDPAELAADPSPQSVATSRFKLIVPLRCREGLDSLKPDFEFLWNLCDRYDTTGFYPYALEYGEDGRPIFFARQFPKRAGYPEDPATGVAASALGAYLALKRVVPVHEGWNRYTIMQGFAMGRPSIIQSDILMEHGVVKDTRVCGSAYLL